MATPNPATEINPYQFVAAWQSSANIDEAKRKLGLNGTVDNYQMSSRASYLRSKGLDLKSMAGGRGAKYDIERLKRYNQFVLSQIESGNTNEEDLSLEAFKNQEAVW